MNSYRHTFNRLVERSIEIGYIERDLARYCRIVGEDFNTVCEHIANEIAANHA